MKPYLYILGVLLVGGGIGYFIGQRTGGAGVGVLPGSSDKIESDDRVAIDSVLSRQREAFALHDEVLLFRDCSANYVEINASTGESFNLSRAMIYHHELLKPGKTVNLLFGNLDVTFLQKAALVRGTYSKTSDYYEQQGFTGLTGNVFWLLSKEGDRWHIEVSAWTEERKR